MDTPIYRIPAVVFITTYEDALSLFENVVLNVPNEKKEEFVDAVYQAVNSPQRLFLMERIAVQYS